MTREAARRLAGGAFPPDDPRAAKAVLFDCSGGSERCWPLLMALHVFDTHVV